MDVISTVRYIMSDAISKDILDVEGVDTDTVSGATNKLGRMGSSTLNLSDVKDPSVALKSELAHILDAKALELAASGGGGGKGKKKEESMGGGGEVEAAGGTATDYSGAALTEDLCACIPPLLLRECVHLRLYTDPKCIKKGYVLDLWKRLFSNLLEYLEMYLGQHKAMDATATSTPAEPEEDSEELESPKKPEKNYLANNTALVVELQVPLCLFFFLLFSNIL